MTKPYTTDFASLSPADLRAARKTADAEVMAAEATLAGRRNKRDALKLEAFRRRNDKRIGAAIDTIKATPALRASLEALRGDSAARVIGPRVYNHPALPAWQVIVGPGHSQHWQNDTDRRMIEIVLALVPAEPAPA